MSNMIRAVKVGRVGAGHVEFVPSQLRRWRCAGIPSALVTLVGVDGSSPRPVGSQMAVTGDGDYVGQITSGCAEGAIAAQAVEFIKENTNGCLRYGRGSRYIDVRLPCGSGIDVYFDSRISTQLVIELDELNNARRPFALTTHMAAMRHDLRKLQDRDGIGAAVAGRVGDRFCRVYRPAIRLLIAGRGPGVVSLVNIAAELGWESIVASPDKATLDTVRPICLSVQNLNRPEDFAASGIDPWTACAVLFHDHDWEPPILAEMLGSRCFYVGALGSRKTHRERLAALQAIGCSAQETSRIHGPIGLDIGARNAPEFALAIAAEILKAARGHNGE